MLDPCSNIVRSRDYEAVIATVAWKSLLKVDRLLAACGPDVASAVPPSQYDDDDALPDLLEEGDGLGVGHALDGDAVDGEDLIA